LVVHVNQDHAGITRSHGLQFPAMRGDGIATRPLSINAMSCSSASATFAYLIPTANLLTTPATTAPPLRIACRVAVQAGHAVLLNARRFAANDL
jgi:hypothetical protein